MLVWVRGRAVPVLADKVEVQGALVFLQYKDRYLQDKQLAVPPRDIEQIEFLQAKEV